jgi:phosphatidylethanolamine/phosphatidyl-N-methylethanolamine N-methyltransferase
MKDSPSAAAKYDFFMRALDLLIAKRWRRELWSGVEGPLVLEVGVGTGLNIPCYRPHLHVTALDSSKSFLELARGRAQAEQVQVNFVLGDVENLPFEENSYDSAVTTFLFCQLADPMQGLKELHRILKPGGQLLLLEHVRSHGIIGRLLASLSEPLYRLTGDHIARDTEVSAVSAGFAGVTSKPLFTNAVRIIGAQKLPPTSPTPIS